MGEAHLLDTNVASIAWDGGHRHHNTVRERLAALGEASVSVSCVTLGEVEYGLRVTPAADAERHAAVQTAMSAYHVFDVDRHTAAIWASIRSELFQRHAPRAQRGRLTKRRPEDLTDLTTGRELGIDENDLWIVSVAVQYDLRFVTTDRMERVLEAAEAAEGYDRAVVWTLTTSDEPAGSATPTPPPTGTAC